MNEGLNNMDQFFKDELEGFSPDVPPMAWDNIAQGIAAKKTKKVGVIWYRIAAGIALFLSVGTIITFLIRDEESPTPINNISLVEDSQSFSNEKIGVDKELSNNLNKVSSTQESIKHSTITRNVSAQENHQNNSAHKSISKNSVATNATHNTSREIITYQGIANIDGYISVEQYKQDLRLNSTQPLTVEEYATFEEFAEYEELVFEENKNRDSKWMIGGQAGPQYSYREITSKNLSNELLARYNSKEEGLLAYAGGINIEFSPVKRLSIQSGIYYSKLGQQKPADLQAPNSSVPHAQRYNPNYTENQTASYKVSNSTGDIVFTNVNTPTLNNESNQLDVAVDKFAFNGASENMITESITLSQYFEYIEVPLIARYSIIDRKFGVHLLGGVSTNILVGNSIYLDNQPNDPAGHTTNVAPINYSSTVGFGLGYTMSENLKFTIEPQIKYFLSSQITQRNITVNPYTIGVMTGIKYLF